jgi:hypothetical protein
VRWSFFKVFTGNGCRFRSVIALFIVFATQPPLKWWRNLKEERAMPENDQMGAETTEQLTGAGNCCRRPKAADRVEPGLMWEKAVHKDIVTSAASILTQYKKEFSAGLGVRFAEEYPKYSKYVRAGLLAADNESPYTDGWYSKHFYDPDERANFFSQSDPTAMTEAIRFFYSSQAGLNSAAYRIHPGEADPLIPVIGTHLGLALHFLTDLTQPMHAANFINFREGPTDLRHEGFEEYADKVRSRFLLSYPQVSPTEIDYFDMGYDSIAELLETVARHSKRVFKEKIWPELGNKMIVTPVGRGMVAISWKREWGIEADAALKESIPYAQKMTAAFLLAWVGPGRDSLVHKIYNRVLERDADSSGLQSWGDCLSKQCWTVRQVIAHIGKSPEYWERFMRPGAEQAVTWMYRHFLAREPESQQVVKAWSSWVNPNQWPALVDQFVYSQEYSQRFGDHRVPR